VLIGRSSILADDTGIGKGRQLAAMAVWANKRGEDVYFVTDRANLFSDLARDLNDIGEWGRFGFRWCSTLTVRSQWMPGLVSRCAYWQKVSLRQSCVESSTEICRCETLVATSVF